MARSPGMSLESVRYGDDRRPLRLWLQVALCAVPIVAILAGMFLTKLGTGRYLEPDSAWAVPSLIAFSVGGAALCSVRRARPVAVVLLASGMVGAVGILSSGVYWL